MNLSYGRFLRNVEANINQLTSENLSKDVRGPIASKLTELANKRIAQKENQFSGVHKFFHKIGQVFKGHGFRTKGEWGLELAAKMRGNAVDEMTRKLAGCIKSGLSYGLNEQRPSEVVKAMKEEINGMPDAFFKKLLSDTLFENKEGAFFGEKNKLIFYSGLSDEKKKIFEQMLLARRDWFVQAFDIVQGADNDDIVQFVTDGMTRRFQQDPSSVIEAYNSIKFKDGWLKQFFQIMVEKAVRGYLSPEPNYLNIMMLAQKLESAMPLGKIFERPMVLEGEEIEKVKVNVRLFIS